MLVFLHSNIENEFPTWLPIYAQVVNMLNYWETEFNICGFACLDQSGHISKRTVFTDVVAFCLICLMVFEWIFIWLIKMHFFSVEYVFLIIKSPCPKKWQIYFVFEMNSSLGMNQCLTFSMGGNTMSSCFCVCTDVIVFCPGCEPPSPCFAAVCLYS